MVVSMRVSRVLVLILAILIAAHAPLRSEETHPPRRPERLLRLMKQMTLEEKISLLSGKDGGQTRSIERLGIPSLRVIDGPLGVGWGVRAVAFPCGLAMAATWNPDLIYETGRALAAETRAAHRHVLLGPCINIVRTPLAGRTFESFSEDPFLTAAIATAYVRGLQSAGVGACLKHFVCNNQEYQRSSISVDVDERTLREIYLKAFEGVIRNAAPWMVMAAYNRVRGRYCCANNYLLTRILRKEWGYRGVVVSDWGAVHSTVPSALAGLDLEMPGPGRYFGPPLLRAVRHGKVPAEVIDAKVFRLLRLLDRTGLLGASPAEISAGQLSLPARRAVARRIAEESIVLLKNRGGLLPLDISRLKSLAVIGPNAAVYRFGGGSSRVTPVEVVTPLEGLKRYCAGRVRIRYARGCTLVPELQRVPGRVLHPQLSQTKRHGLHARYFATIQPRGKPAVERRDPAVDFDWGDRAPATGLPADRFSVCWSGVLVPEETGEYEFGMISDDGCRIWLDGRLIIDHWSDQWAVPRTARCHFQAGRPYRLRIEYYENSGAAVARLVWRRCDSASIREAVKAARRCDVAIVFVGLSENFEAEGRDRENIALPGDQDRLVAEVAKVNPHTVVVLITGSPVSVEKWIDDVPAVLCAWYPGQEGGHAIARILFGDISPSGKLPVSFPRRLEDTAAYGNYPGKHGVVHYREGVFVGYRHYDKHRLLPRFPFGYGLSYTRFVFGRASLRPSDSPHGLPLTISVTVSNCGSRAGAEVVQLYVHDVASRIPRPFKELKGFRKIFLLPGEAQTVSFRLDKDAFSFWDPERRRWTIEPGQFEILLGTSSRHIHAHRRWLAK